MPGETAVAIPELLMLATAVLLLVQVPPPDASFRVVVPPIQIVVIPVIGDDGFTVTEVVAVDISPHASVQVTV